MIETWRFKPDEQKIPINSFANAQIVLQPQDYVYFSASNGFGGKETLAVVAVQISVIKVINGVAQSRETFAQRCATGKTLRS
jgi:hypothetical protein